MGVTYNSNLYPGCTCVNWGDLVKGYKGTMMEFVKTPTDYLAAVHHEKDIVVCQVKAESLERIKTEGIKLAKAEGDGLQVIVGDSLDGKKPMVRAFVGRLAGEGIPEAAEGMVNVAFYPARQWGIVVMCKKSPQLMGLVVNPYDIPPENFVELSEAKEKKMDCAAFCKKYMGFKEKGVKAKFKRALATEDMRLVLDCLYWGRDIDKPRAPTSRKRKPAAGADATKSGSGHIEGERPLVEGSEDDWDDIFLTKEEEEELGE